MFKKEAFEEGVREKKEEIRDNIFIHVPIKGQLMKNKHRHVCEGLNASLRPCTQFEIPFSITTSI